MVRLLLLSVEQKVFACRPLQPEEINQNIQVYHYNLSIYTLHKSIHL